MKRLILFILLFLGIMTTSGAYDRLDYNRLLTTGNCLNCDLSRGNFNGMDLSGADLSGSDLSYTQFRRAILKEVELFGTTWMGTDFSHAYWYDGSICDANSIDRCIRKKK